MSKAIIHTPSAPAAIGPYSQAVRCGRLLFASGQLGLNPATGTLAQGVEAQAEQALRNLGAILQAAGLGYADIVKTTVFLSDLGDFAAVNAVYQRFFTDDPPARSCVQVAALPKGGLVEIECIATGGNEEHV